MIKNIITVTDYTERLMNTLNSKNLVYLTDNNINPKI